MQRFWYPKNDGELLDHQYARDFLRVPDDFPDHVDFNYLRNQRDAVNYFIDWFSGDTNQSYVEMLRECHQLASVGRSGVCVYKIRWRDHLLIPSVGDDGVVAFEAKDLEMFRETHPGVFRSELLEAGIPHPTRDIFELTEEEFYVLSKLGKYSFGGELEWCRSTGRSIRVVGSSGRYSISFDQDGLSHEVIVTELGNLVCRNPTGQDYAMMRKMCEKKMYHIRCNWNPEKRSEMTILISLYYHAAINWMPFSNVNNSILMAQINYLRRSLGVEPLAHSNLDKFALLTSSKGFLQLIQ